MNEGETAVRKSDMDLPPGMTASDCAHFLRCSTMFGCKSGNINCDFAPSRFAYRSPKADFDGKTFAPALDGPRLSRQLDKVRELMLDGQWRKLRSIQDVAGGSEAAISARLRDLRKPKFGGFRVDRRRAGDPSSGSWEYRVLPPAPDGQPTLL